VRVGAATVRERWYPPVGNRAATVCVGAAADRNGAATVRERWYYYS
jgi:hypothetical protein